MFLSDFDYNLPSELIAQNPLEERHNSRLLYYDRKNDEINHRHFYDLPEILRSGDLLVLNQSRVIPARLEAKTIVENEVQENKNEVFLIKQVEENKWEALVKPGKRLKEDVEIYFSEKLKGKITEIKDGGMRIIEFSLGGKELESEIEKIGHTPLPPYIKESTSTPDQYQTVYAKEKGSVAAPTAGLHFTPEIFEELEKKGIEKTFVTLHVGWGTFAPVKTEKIEEHEIHSEWYEVSAEAAEKINKAKAEGRRVIAVGTTSVRTLESAANEQGFIQPETKDTCIFIYPGYEFKIINGLITNFHLPKSSLIMLTSALIGREKNLEIYNEAIKESYRFFSFGDACLFL